MFVYFFFRERKVEVLNDIEIIGIWLEKFVIKYIFIFMVKVRFSVVYVID